MTRSQDRLFVLVCLALVIAMIIYSCATTHATTNTATFSWSAVTKFVDGSTIPSTDTVTYNIYYGTNGAGSESTTPKITGLTALTWTAPTTFSPGEDVCGEVTATVNGVESGRSNEACKLFPSVPAAPANLTAK